MGQGPSRLPAEIPPWPNFHDDFAGKPPIYQRHHDSFVGEGNPRRTWDECAVWAALYFGFATQIDAQIGRVLAALDELGLGNSTAVLMSADHGDLTGSHGGMHDKNALGVEELMHIPLMARLPADNPSGAGATCDLPVSNLDIPATVMDLAGAGVPECFDGRSLLPILRGERPGDWPDYVTAECSGVHFAYETRMVVWDRFKYVFHPGSFDELYDLQEDPHELANQIDSADCAHALRECRRRLLTRMRQTRDPLHRAFFLFEKRPIGAVPVDDFDSLKLGADLLGCREVAFDHHDGRPLLQQVTRESFADDATADDTDPACLAFLAEEALRGEHAFGASDQIHSVALDQHVRTAWNEQVAVTNDRAH